MPDGKVLDGQVVAIQYVHGDSVHHPLADIDVEIGERRRTIHARVSNRLPVEVLLGFYVQSFQVYSCSKQKERKILLIYSDNPIAVISCT